jgi:hypothetical protein
MSFVMASDCCSMRQNAITLTVTPNWNKHFAYHVAFLSEQTVN